MAWGTRVYFRGGVRDRVREMMWSVVVKTKVAGENVPLGWLLRAVRSAQKASSFGKAGTNSDDVIVANDCVTRKIDSVSDEKVGLIERV